MGVSEDTGPSKKQASKLHPFTTSVYSCQTSHPLRGMVVDGEKNTVYDVIFTECQWFQAVYSPFASKVKCLNQRTIHAAF